MNVRMQDVLTCPICIELLRKPILVLPCQHNLCKLCVAQLCKKESLKNRCPTCRREFSLGPGGINDLSRNYLVEEMIEELSKAKTGPNFGAETHSKAETRSSKPETLLLKDKAVDFRKIADQLMADKKYAKAKTMLESIQDRVEEIQRVQTKLDIIKCCMEVEDDQTVHELGKIIIPTLSSIHLPEKDKDVAANLMRTFAKELSGNNENITAINLLQSASDVCSGINDSAKQLDELMSCLELMQGIAKAMAKRDMKQEFKQFMFPAINHIFRYITKVQLSDGRLRCTKIAWSLKYIGFCCNEIGDYEKSVEYNNRSINHLKEHLHQQASQYRVMGVSYHNLAAAYKNMEKYVHAEAAYLKAFEAYYIAKDWPSEERRNNSVVLSAIGLSETHKLLQKLQRKV